MEYTQSAWKLDDLYPGQDNELFRKDLEEIKQRSEAFEAYRPLLTEDISEADFLKIIKDYETLHELAYQLMGYCELRFSADTQDPAIMALMGQTEADITELFNKTMFFGLWWRGVSDETADRLIKAAKGYEYYLSSSRLFKPHTLSEAEEKIINIKELSGKSALTNLYASLTNRYVFKVTIDGEEKKMTRGELMSYAHSEKKEEREAAYKELYRVYGDDGNILGQIYQAVCRDWDQENLGLRSFRTPCSVRNLYNDIPDEVVDLLLSTCQKNKTIFIDYFKYKKTLLGLDEMHRYDLYASAAADTSHVSFDEAMKTVLAAYNEFDPEFAAMAEKVYTDHHIDSEVRHGKRGGAFCQTISPRLTPWVLVNFQGKNDDVSTLAHELGHAIHSLSANQQTLFEQHSCLPLAETASTFGEMLLSDYMEKEISDPAVLRAMLVKQIDDNYATIQRQSYFALFEKEAHRMIAEGAGVDELNACYLANLQDQFGDSMIVDDYFKWEWVSIPHIYNTPFYVYAYAFGQLLVLSLYNQYQIEGRSFIPRYKEMLRKGGSQRPAELLLDAGFDFTKESFWQGGFDILKGKVDRLIALS